MSDAPYSAPALFTALKLLHTAAAEHLRRLDDGVPIGHYALRNAIAEAEAAIAKAERH